MIAVVITRAGLVPAGAAEVTEEAGGHVLLMGTGVADAVAALYGSAETVLGIEMPSFDVVSYTAALAPLLCDMGRPVLLPGSPDGRDVAPRLAAALGWPLFAHAMRIERSGPRGARVSTVHASGRAVDDTDIEGPFVATLISGVRGTSGSFTDGPSVEFVAPNGPKGPDGDAVAHGAGEVRLIELLPPDPATMDLGEAVRIAAGGQGLGGKDRFDVLAAVGLALGASLGGTRVASDAGWIPFERQIGSTGVTVNPRLYLAFGISGATQHTSGLGHPDHIISVNLDGSCPMMAMADLAIVSDARAVLDQLAQRLGVVHESGAGR